MSVLRWLLGRLAAAALVAWVVATVVFFALRAAGGDPSEAILGGPGSQASEEAVERVRAEYALDQPLLVQYLLQLARTVTFRLGDSYARRRPVSELIGDQVGGTLALAALGLLLAWVIALVVATAAVRARGPVARRAVGLLREHDCTSVWFGAAAPLGLMAPALRKAGATRLVATTHGHEAGWAQLPAARRLLRRIG